MEIKDKRRAENLAVDHLSRLEGPYKNVLEKREINDTFPGQQHYNIEAVMYEEIPWFTDIANYLAVKTFPKWLTYQHRKKLFPYLKSYVREDPYLFKIYSNQFVRRCLSQVEGQDILRYCHSDLTGAHYSANRTRKILDAGFYRTLMFQDTQEHVLRCDRCQCARNLSCMDEMPQNWDQVCKVFDVWDIDFMGPFPSSHGQKFILMVVDYLSRWVEAKELPTSDARAVVKFLKKLFSRFTTIRAIIID